MAAAMTMMPPRDSELVADVEHLSHVVRRLQQEVRSMEGRQVMLDRRLAEFDAALQGLQEEQHSQNCALAIGQKTLAAGTKRALHAAATVQQKLQQDSNLQSCLEGLGVETSTDAKRLETEISRLESTWNDRLEEQERWINELASNQMQQVSDAVQSLSASGSDETQGSCAPLGQRLFDLERSVQTVASSARRALQTALVVHKRQEHAQDMETCLETLEGENASGLDELCTQRFSEQDDRLEKILLIVDVLADRVQETSSSVQAITQGDSRQKGALTDREEEMREKVEHMEGNLYGLASQVHSHLQEYGRAAMGLQDQRRQQHSTESLALALDSLDARLERNLMEFGQRLDVLQDGCEDHQVALRKLGQQLPEVSNRLEQLWGQCQQYFPRFQEQDVHVGFLRTSFEAHKEQLLELSEHLSRVAGLQVGKSNGRTSLWDAASNSKAQRAASGPGRPKQQPLDLDGDARQVQRKFDQDADPYAERSKP
ncbi:unnamed protein product [Polarella glacialis]|uniref:Uncharacterized protein n=1 Tax=Polarella glacialis TaxID=89957 RepID=A0A813DAP0_POLGL|nr:unnamed protein product [Polarella glacialis]CAE8611288.1 unnamed protein product [Polarella glacialis]